MHFTILDFSQEHMEVMGLSLNDAMVLRWLVDVNDPARVPSVRVGEYVYYYIDAKAVLSDIPILRITEEEVYRCLESLVRCRVLGKENLISDGGEWVGYRFAENYWVLVDSSGTLHGYTLGEE